MSESDSSRTGYLSSAFVISAIVVALSMGMAFGASLLDQNYFEPGSDQAKLTTAILQAAGVLAAALTAAGYTFSNALVKNAEKRAVVDQKIAQQRKETAEIERAKSYIDLETKRAELESQATPPVRPPSDVIEG